MIFAAEIQGIPCQVRVTCYRPPVPPIIGARADDSDPGDPGIQEFDVLDLQGRPAPGLERLMRSEDARVIEEEIIAAMTADAEQARADDAAAIAFAEWGAWA